MRKNLKLALLGISLVFLSASLFIMPKNVSATEDGKQWIEVKCDDLNGTVDCNDCKSGTKNCNDNSCTACYGGSIGV